ncbi:hypothetical protein P170DRAFT_475324 [Aspergillus steynii IBT 23096]|uniref:Zn(2)-C6 fungal-type domain-containing protein n=1 Tax=Aspergillus steynii IBT 23096 TaxID=1392250 RepID=A0A2I2G820_9EURO|nr:uncharacterized protein P170DRAFT_475324 [Aspergillus steynii IBT 23096]PLB48993.1 hypothetical protein P170DRAFT_475324 [Aspergillus steynii IBT 23096]
MTTAVPYLASPTEPPQDNPNHKQKLRSACDSCHQCKVKCSGGSPCFRCASKGFSCRYGYQNRAGKPKGSKNRKTLERAHQMRMQWLTEQLRGGNVELDEMTLNATDPSAFLPSPALSVNRWKSAHTPRSSSGSAPLDSTHKSAAGDITDEALPSPHNLDPWTTDLGSFLDTTPGSRSTSMESFTTPMSFTNGVGYFGPPNDPATPLTFDLPSPLPDLGRSGTICACVQSQATNVTTLHQLTSHQSFERFDLAMKSVTATLDTCDNFIACLECEKSFSAILLTLSALEMIFKLFEQLIIGHQYLLPQEEHRMISCSLGDYKVSQEEGQAIQNVLLKMTLSKAKQTLDSLHTLVTGPMEFLDDTERYEAPGADKGSPQGLGGLSNVDRDYIVQCITRKKTALDVLMTTVIV